MPLHSQKPKSIKIPITQKVNSVISRSLVFINPNTILGVFLITSIFLSFFQIQAMYFYIVFGVFIIGYFAERTMVIIGRYKLYAKQTKTK